MIVFYANSAAANEPDFSWAISQYYNDIIRCTGALQAVPAFLRRFVLFSKVRPSANSIRITCNLITKHGCALEVLLSRLLEAMDLHQAVWNEKDALKNVGR